MDHLLSFSFWFNAFPTRLSPVLEIAFLVLFGLCAVGAIAARRQMRSGGIARLAWRRAAAWLSWLAVFGMVWVFTSWQELRIFGMRFWFVLWIVLAVMAIWRVRHAWLVEGPELALRTQQRSDAQRYLPRRAR